MSKSAPDFSLHDGAKGGGQLGRARDFMKVPDPQIEQGQRGADRIAAVARGLTPGGNKLGTGAKGQKMDARRIESDPDEFRTDSGRGAEQEYPTASKAKSAVRSGDKVLKTVKPKG